MPSVSPTQNFLMNDIVCKIQVKLCPRYLKPITNLFNHNPNFYEEVYPLTIIRCYRAINHCERREKKPG